MVEENNKNSKIGVGARVWGCRIKPYAVLFKIWPDDNAVWRDMDNILNGLDEYWYRWGMNETQYMLYRETPEGLQELAQGFVQIYMDLTSTALGPVPTVFTPASTIPELESIGTS